MFTLRIQRKAPPGDLLTSKLFDEHSFYPTFIHDLKRCQEEVIIESPYLATKRVNLLLPTFRKLTKRGVKVTIHTRYPEHHDELLRIQGWMAAKQLKQIGIKVKFFNNYHHRKIAVVDGRILWEGSLNILSQSYSKEVMRRIESEELTRQMIKFLGLKRFWQF